MTRCGRRRLVGVGGRGGQALVLLFALAGAPGAMAEYGRIPPTAIDPAALAIDEARHLGASLDRTLRLRDETGRTWRLGELLDRPLLLVLAYYRCDGSCPTVQRHLAQTLAQVSRLRLGEDYRVLTVSFDAHDDALRLAHFAERFKPAGTGWYLALAESAEDLQRLVDAVGFKYFWSVRDRVFLHPNVVIVVTPEGRVARYLYGVRIGPRDVELALLEARGGRIAPRAGQMLDFLTGLCFSYNFSAGRYTLNYPLFIAIGAWLGGVALVVFSFTVYRIRKPRRTVHV